MTDIPSPKCSSLTIARATAVISTIASMTTIVTAILTGIVGITMIAQRLWKMLA